MATRTRATNRVTAPVFKSKSDFVRALLREGKTVTEAAATAQIGYAFAYGIASRAGLNLTAAKRRKVKTVSKAPDGSVTIQTTAGPVTVHPDGSVTKAKTPKVKA